MTRTLPILVVSFLTACSDGSDPQIEPADTTDPTAAEETSAAAETGVAADPFACLGEDFVPSPLAGPGIDPQTGAIVGKPAAKYVLHTTQAVLDPQTAADFLGLTTPVIDQVMQADGLVGVSLASDMNCGFARTLGIWESEEAMYEFVYAGAHAQAISVAPDLTLTGRFTHFDIEPTDIDKAWDLAFAALEHVEPPPIYD
jgi:hypothetical protein